MLTVFSIPKSLLGHIGVIQRNALGSWVRLREGVQVILFARILSDNTGGRGIRLPTRVRCARA
jgi:hypothetical protein